MYVASANVNVPKTTASPPGRHAETNDITVGLTIGHHSTIGAYVWTQNQPGAKMGANICQGNYHGTISTSKVTRKVIGGHRF